MKKIIVITGTPTSGKTSISERLSGMLNDSELIKANDLVKEKRLFTGYSKDGEIIADMKRLRLEIEKIAASSKANLVIFEGHLLCDMKIKGATVIVIREHLKTLLERMEKRGYSMKKIESNIVSEAIDYCGVNSMENYDSVYEIWGGKGAANEIIKIINGKIEKPKEIDVLGELNGMAQYLGKAAL